MFGLIPMTITIILAAVVLLSVAYFSGGIYGDSSEDAQALRIINEGEQISNAIKMYRFKEMQSPPDLTTVITDKTYYKGGAQSVAGAWSDAPTGLEGIAANVSSENVCRNVNLKIGYDGAVPTCDAVPAELSDKSRYYCCTTP